MFLLRVVSPPKALAEAPSNTQLAVLLLMFLVRPILPTPRSLTTDTFGKPSGGHKALLLLTLMVTGCLVSRQTPFLPCHAHLSDQTISFLVSACSGSNGVNSTTTTTTTTTTAKATTTTTVSTTTKATTTTPATTTTTTKTTTTASATPTGSGGNCNGVAAWSSTTAYVTGSTVTYNGHLWSAKWWTEAETPSSTSSVWVDGGACTSSSKRRRQLYARRRF
jgi:hypothetical protein